MIMKILIIIIIIIINDNSNKRVNSLTYSGSAIFGHLPENWLT